MVNIYKDHEIIAVVKYNNNLDVWNGSNWQNGGTGRHLGISAIMNKDGEKRFVLIHGSDWEGQSDYGEIISDEHAFQKIMRYNPELLDEDKFESLKRFKKNLYKEID